MSYIGQQLPADVFSGFTTDAFTGDGSATTFTLSKAPFSEDTLIVVINNVIQKPTTNFTVSGTTLTIVGTAVADGDVLYAIHTGGPIPITTPGDNSVTSAKLSGNLVTPGTLDVNGQELILDADADTSITADTDDQIDFKAGGTDRMSVTSSGVDVTGAITASSASSINVTGGSALTLKSTDAGSSAGPVLKLQRDSASPADADFAGAITYIADNDAGEATDYAKIDLQVDDASDGSEDGQLFFRCMGAGTLANRIAIYGSNTVINDDSQDVDFRVESNNNANMIKVDAGDDRTHFGSTGHQGQNLGVHNFYSGTTSDQSLFSLGSNASNYASDLIKLGCLRSQSNQYTFMECLGGNGSNTINSDLEFRVKGDGNVQCDESFTGGGVDYAEFFEWKDGNSSSEDRRGYSVVLDGNKIVKATDSDDTSKIIGIVSTNPTVLGGGDMERWVYKYERDDYDSVIWEEYTVTEWKDEDGKDHSYDTDRIPSDVTAPSDATVISEEKDRYGNTIKLKRRKLNPEWDSTKDYISREDRKEWQAIGLMGKLRLLKGQPTGTNWIKMRDISDTIEEWLVR